jgi:hypothetical protein
MNGLFLNSTHADLEFMSLAAIIAIILIIIMESDNGPLH